MAIKTTQVTLYMKTRHQGKTQLKAAAQADLSVRTAQRLDAGQHNSQQPDKSRDYATRKDPLADVWENELAAQPVAQEILTMNR